MAIQIDNEDFLDLPPGEYGQGSIARDLLSNDPRLKADMTAAQANREESLACVAGLRFAKESWESRNYVPNTPWTSTNENRRRYNLDTINNLLQWWQEKEFFTPRQKQLARQMERNAKASERG